MKKIVTFLAFAITVGTSLAQVNIHGDKNFTGDVNLDGSWRVKATTVTATGAEINQLPDLIAGTGIDLASNKVFIGQSTGKAGAQTLTGDITTTPAGVTAIGARKVTAGMLPAATAGQILAGQANSNLAAKTVGGDLTMDADGDFTIAARAVEVTMLPAMTTGQMMVGDTSDSDANVVAISGDITVNASGAVAIGARKVTGAMLPAATTGQILVGDTADSNPVVKTMGGDATINANGEVALAARSVAGAELPVATVGQILAGQADSNALVKTLGGDVSMDADGLVTVSKDLAMTAGGSLTNVPYGSLVPTWGGVLNIQSNSPVITTASLVPGVREYLIYGMDDTNFLAEALTVTFEAPGTSQIGHEYTLTPGTGEGVIFTINTEFVAPFASEVPMTNDWESMTIIGHDSARWLLKSYVPLAW